MFRRAIAPPTAEQQARQDAARELGCIACRQWKNYPMMKTQCGPSEIHHQTRSGSGRQIGQDETVCLGSWHHRAICLPGYTASQMEAEFGPSLARGSKPFYRVFGTNYEQLQFQNELIERWHGK